jgi:hypothetical protein
LGGGSSSDARSAVAFLPRRSGETRTRAPDTRAVTRVDEVRALAPPRGAARAPTTTKAVGEMAKDIVRVRWGARTLCPVKPWPRVT